MFFFHSDRVLLHHINKKVNTIMAQIDDLKSAVADELSDANALLNKLSQQQVVQDDPQVADLIKQLKQSHQDIQTALAPKQAQVQVAP